jgi:hypothetical protein
MKKYLIGILSGILIMCLLLWGFRVIINPQYALSVPHFVTDTSKKRPSQEDIIALTKQFLLIEEKTVSTNKRMDDILVFGGIIITLLLAINVSIFVNAERLVEKYFKENFETHKKRAEKYADDALRAASKTVSNSNDEPKKTEI